MGAVQAMRFTTVEGGVGGQPKTYPEYSRSVYETAARELGPAVADLRASHPTKVKATPLYGFAKMDEGPHVRGCSGHRTKPKVLGRSAQSTPRRKSP